MKEVKKILYATDLSETAKEAMDWAKSLTDKYGAEITIIHIIHDVSKEIDGFGADRTKPSIDIERNDAITLKQQEILQLCKERHKGQPDCKIDLDHILVRIGTPVKEILATVDDGDFDMVIMGTYSQGLLAKVLLGSVAKGVVEQCNVPVLTVRLAHN